MVEAAANEATEAEILDALDIAHQEIKKLCAAQRELAAPGRQAQDRDAAARRRHGALRADPLVARRRARSARRRSRTSSSGRPPRRRSRRRCWHSTRSPDGDEPVDPARRSAVQLAFDKLEKDIIRRRIAVDKRRPDGRAADEIREVSLRGRRSRRGRTARRSSRAGRRRPSPSATLGTSREEQRLDTLGLETSKRYMHHYNFPPFSVGRGRLHAWAEAA